jgi:hypothetical protein
MKGGVSNFIPTYERWCFKSKQITQMSESTLMTKDELWMNYAEATRELKRSPNEASIKLVVIEDPEYKVPERETAPIETIAYATRYAIKPGYVHTRALMRDLIRFKIVKEDGMQFACIMDDSGATSTEDIQTQFEILKRILKLEMRGILQVQIRVE